MSAPRVDLQTIPDPIILAGDEHTAYRDPLLHYHDGIFRLLCSVVEAQPDGNDFPSRRDRERRPPLPFPTSPSTTLNPRSSSER